MGRTAAQREKDNQQRRRYYQEHRAEILIKKKAYRDAHREERRQRQREYNKRRYATHSGEYKTRAQLYHAAHREERLAYARARVIAERATVLQHYGGKCVCCGETEPKFLSLDHIKNNGGKHRKAIHAGGSSFYHWVIKHDFPADLQLLCHNCNMAKGFYGQCPHQEASK